MQTPWKMLPLIGIALSVMVLEAWAENYPKMTLRYANYIPEKAPNSKVDIFVANELTKRTNGRVQVIIYHGQTLGKSTEMIDLVGGGAVDIGNFSHGYSFARLPMNAFFNTPMIYRDHIIAGKISKLGYQTQKKYKHEGMRDPTSNIFRVVGMLARELNARAGILRSHRRTENDLQLNSARSRCHLRVHRPQLPLVALVTLYTVFVGLVLYLVLALSDPFQGDIGVAPTSFEYLVAALQS